MKGARQFWHLSRVETIPQRQRGCDCDGDGVTQPRWRWKIQADQTQGSLGDSATAGLEAAIPEEIDLPIMAR